MALKNRYDYMNYRSTSEQKKKGEYRVLPFFTLFRKHSDPKQALEVSIILMRETCPSRAGWNG